jgi:hypothetical protein
MSAILSWSAANLAAASAERATAAGGQEGSSVMATLSDELGASAERDLEEVELKLKEQTRRAEQGGGEAADAEKKVDWEAVLAARLMLSQASICRGDVGLWRARLRQAASVRWFSSFPPSFTATNLSPFSCLSLPHRSSSSLVSRPREGLPSLEHSFAISYTTTSSLRPRAKKVSCSTTRASALVLMETVLRRR